jgi:hypothetical protein
MGDWYGVDWPLGIWHWALGLDFSGRFFVAQWATFLTSGRKHIYKTGLKPGICKNHSFGYFKI